MTPLLVLLVLQTAAPCVDVHSPFADGNRRSFAAFNKRVSSGFGDARRSYVKGHKHAGVDLRTSYGDTVLAMCPGTVVDIHLTSPHRTVVVRHEGEDGVWFSSYKHVEDVHVKVGDEVTEKTRIGRVFNQREQQDAPWRLNHLHLEIRHNLDDEGTASWMSMRLEELKRYAHDPQTFLRRRMHK